MAHSNVEIDDSLYSRQRYVLGDNAMHKLAASNIFLFGLNGLGVEIAKNLVLAGVKSVVINDPRIVQKKDQGSQFFIREDDLTYKKTRAQTCQSRIAELNSYVNISINDELITENSDLRFLHNFQCVVMTECPIELQLKVNSFCRSQFPPIKFVMGDVCGVFSWGFCDFGDEFEVIDSDGEEPKEVFINNITKSNPGVVTTSESMMHGFESGDVVTFQELTSMQVLNGFTCQIKVLSPHKFTIIDTTPDVFTSFSGAGIVKKVKTKKIMSFKSLEKQLVEPSYVTADLGKFQSPMSIHLCMLTLHQFILKFNRLPRVWSVEDSAEFKLLAELACSNVSCLDWNDIDKSVLEKFSFTCQGCFPPLCAFLGGVLAQEVLKALSNKFTPIQQWLHFDVAELVSDTTDEPSNYQMLGDRYDDIRICIGNNLLEKLKSLKVFMVGCGAIGCELLKNFALLGVGSSGQIIATDNDLIEKSNLNRQFLFRNEHIQKPKSVTAASSVLQINPALNIKAQQHKVGWETEAAVYSDTFFKDLDVVVNALDNVEARRYVDGRCVSNQKPLLESGTMSTKGHVQVILPFLTESYTSQNDPDDGVDVPYCTLRSFPANMEHCIEWAREKFEDLFVHKPNLYNDFWRKNSFDEIHDMFTNGTHIDGCKLSLKLASTLPKNWVDCLELARIKFDKFFNFKARNLLLAFPLNTTVNDGSLFWQLPKRPPTPIEFDVSNPLHFSFVTSCGQLLAFMSGIRIGEEFKDSEATKQILSNIHAPMFCPKNKHIETDESVQKPKQVETVPQDGLDQLQFVKEKFGVKGQNEPSSGLPVLNPQTFEKDDDTNGHIDFIAAASNLRGSMYGISNMDRLQIKKIAGRIVPAIATTTAAVSALVTMELVKIAKNSPFSDYRNSFLNLALSLFVLSEPGAVKKNIMSSGREYTIWDRWDIKGNPSMTLMQFIKAIKKKYEKEATFVVHGTKLIFSVDMLMIHKKRLTQKMTSLIKMPQEKPYIDLVVSFKKGMTDDGQRDDESGPEIRYYHGLELVKDEVGVPASQ